MPIYRRWTFMEPNIEWVLQQAEAKITRPRYVGRPASASTAAGSVQKHKEEQDALINDALTL